MKICLGVGLAAAIMALSGAASIEGAEATPRSVAVAAHSMPLTDVGAARRAHRGHRLHGRRHHRPRVYVSGPYRPYYERPNYYVPRGPAPFFPFGFGYGLDPSW
ncbi:MAG: hypothetical protein NTAFB05_24480 [Nitrobacter sp.]|uniref:hypothetical protein n=1 Tax=Nitrobacter sp. TaxID=29420 RepID=UPI00387DDC55